MGNCQWPASGGSITHAEYFIHANNLSKIPQENSFRNDVWNGITYLDQDSMILDQDTGASYNLILNDSLNIADPGFELLLAWQEETGAPYGNDFEFKAGVYVYEKNQILNIARNVPVATSTLDSGSAADEILITDLTANLSIQTSPSPLTAAPFYAIVWIFRAQDEVNKYPILHSLRLRHKVT